MSVVIAAITESRGLVVGSDMMASLLNGTFSADWSMTKGMELVFHRWAAAFAGDDVGRAAPILARTKAELAQRASWPVEQVAACLLRHYQIERTKVAAEEHLGLYDGMDMAQFMSNGSIVFGEQGFGAMRERLEQVDLGCSFLLHGFDEDGQPHLVQIEHPGRATFINIGYWAIGSGAYMALSRLALRKQHSFTSVTETVYNVLEAKVAAESALGVGRATFLEVFEAGKRSLKIEHKTGNAAMSYAHEQLAPKVSPKIIRSISRDLEKAFTSREKAEQEARAKEAKQ